VRVDSFPNKVFEGQVEQINQQAEFLPRNVQTREGARASSFRCKSSHQSTPQAKSLPEWAADVKTESRELNMAPALQDNNGLAILCRAPGAKVRAVHRGQRCQLSSGARGEIFWFPSAPTAAEKTTVIKMLTGLLPLTSGKSLRRRRRRPHRPGSGAPETLAICHTAFQSLRRSHRHRKSSVSTAASTAFRPTASSAAWMKSSNSTVCNLISIVSAAQLFRRMEAAPGPRLRHAPRTEAPVS